MDDSFLTGLGNSFSPIHWLQAAFTGIAQQQVANERSYNADGTPNNDHNWFQTAVGGIAGGISGQFRDTLSNTLGPMMSWASDVDPTKPLFTGPVMWALHHAGIGKQGDEWDKGVIGLLGTSFDKIGRLGTTAALITGSVWDPRTGSVQFDPRLVTKSWQAAFAGGQHVGFGEAVLGSSLNPLGYLDQQASGVNDRSLIEDPEALNKMRAHLNSTWYGDIATGAYDVAFYALADPTKGVGKVAELARAGNFIKEATAADRVITAGNKALDEAKTATPLDEEGKAQKLNLGPLPNVGKGNTLRRIVGLADTSDPALYSRHMQAMDRTFGEQDLNKLVNELSPRLGEGTNEARQATVALAEMFQTIAQNVSDRTLQAQAKLNAYYAMTGSEKSMQWLAENVPAAAAKGMRVSSAPAEFSLLRNAMADFAKTNDLSEFKLSQYLQEHFDSPAVKAELETLGAVIQRTQAFFDKVADPSAEVARSGLGLQVVPDALATAKTALRNKTYNSIVIQPGAAGRTIRLISGLTTDSLGNGRVNVTDPIAGARQLQFGLARIGKKLGLDDNGNPYITPAQVQDLSQQFLKANIEGRKAIVEDLNSQLVGHIMDRFGVTENEIKGLNRVRTAIETDSRTFSTNATRAASIAGQRHVFVGDLGGLQTVLDRAFLEKQIQDTVPFYDFDTTYDLVKGYINGRRVQTNMLKAAGQGLWETSHWGFTHGLLPFLAWYQKVWRYAVLGRPGLLFRALWDTGMRATAMVGISTYMHEAMVGAMGFAARHGLSNALTRNWWDGATNAFIDNEAAASARATAGEVRAAGDAIPVTLEDVQRHKDMARDFKRKARHAAEERPLPEGVAKFELVDENPPDTISPERLAHYPGRGYRTLVAKDENGREIGYVTWSTVGYDPGEIQMIQVLHDYQRRGIATELFYRARDIDSRVHHSDVLTPQGREYVGSRDWDNYDPIRHTRDYFNRLAAEQRALAKAVQKTYDRKMQHYAAADALNAAADKYEATPMLQRRQDLSSQSRNHHGYDMALTTNAAEREIYKRTITGDQQMSGAILGGRTGERIAQWRMDGNHWSGNVMRDDPAWYEKYSQAMRDIQYSHTAKRILTEWDAFRIGRTPDAVIRSFLQDPRVAAEARRFGGVVKRDDVLQWLDDLHLHLENMTPTAELRDAFAAGKVLKPNDVRQMVAPNERFDIYGPHMLNVRAMDMQNGLKARLESAIDKHFNTFLNMPDMYWTRIPVANALFHKNIDDLLVPAMQKARAEGRELTATELETIRQRAKYRAANDVRRDMYDVSRYVGAHGVMSYIAPFYAPWEDAMASWGRLMYDDPSRIGLLMRTYALPDMLGMTVDKDGKPVQPWDPSVHFRDKFLRVPVAWLPGMKGQQAFRINISTSFSTIAQGDYPLSPGFGPVAQVAATGVVTQVLPHVLDGQLYKAISAHSSDNPILIQLFPQGQVPKGSFKDMVASQLPSYVRTLSDVLLGENGFGNTYTNALGTAFNQKVIDWREAHGGADPTNADLRDLYRQAQNDAKAAGVLRTAASFGLGLSGSAEPRGQFYLDKMHLLIAQQDKLKALGTTPEQVFAQLYPEAAGLNFRFTENKGGLVASVDAVDSYNRYRGLMQRTENQQIQWWIAGPANKLPPGNSIDQGAYNEEVNLGLRRKLTPEELFQAQEASMGAYRWDQFNLALNAFMQEQGITSLQSKAAGGLSALRAQYKEQLRLQYPGWAQQLDTQNFNQRQGQIEAISRLVDDPKLKDRPDVVTTKQYLIARAAFEEMAKQRGIAQWQTAKSMSSARNVLYQYGSQLANQDPVFQTAWNRLFAPEFESNKPAVTNQSVPTEVLNQLVNSGGGGS